MFCPWGTVYSGREREDPEGLIGIRSAKVDEAATTGESGTCKENLGRRRQCSGMCWISHRRSLEYCFIISEDWRKSLLRRSVEESYRKKWLGALRERGNGTENKMYNC